MKAKTSCEKTIVLYRNAPSTAAKDVSSESDEQSTATRRPSRPRALGISIVGGADSPRGPMGIFVKSVSPKGLAFGFLRPGDEVLSLNGVALAGKSHAQALQLFKKYRRSDVTICIRRDCPQPLKPTGGASADDAFAGATTTTSELIRVTDLEANLSSAELGRRLQGGGAGSSSPPSALAPPPRVSASFRHRRRSSVAADQSAARKWATMSRKSNVLLRTKRELGNFLGPSASKMRTKVVLKRKSLQQRLGLGIAIENDDEINRIVRVLVEDVDPGSVAQSGGLKLGDEILTVNGVELRQCSREECLRLFDQAALSMKLTIRPYASRKDLKIRSQSQPKPTGKASRRTQEVQATMEQFSPLRAHSPTNSRDSGHSSDTANGILSPAGRHEGLLRPFGRLPDNSDMGEYVSVFSPNGSATGTIPRVYHGRSGSSIYEDMDRRVSKSQFRPLNALMPLEIDAAIVHTAPRASRSPVKVNDHNGPHGGPHFPLEIDGRNPPPKPTNRAAKQPPPLAAKPAPAPRSHSTASSTMGGSMSGGASTEIQTLTLDAEEITRLAEKQVAARKRSRDSLIGDEEEEEDGFQRSTADRRRPSESEDSAVPQETASLSPTSSSGDASSQENGKRWNPAPVDIAKWRPTAPFAVDNRPKTGWQQIKEDQELRKSANESVEEEDDGQKNPAPRKKVNQLIKQFAQLDTGEIPLPQNPVPKPPRPAMRACFSSTFQMSASLYAPKSPLYGPTRSLEASLYSHRDRSASPLRQTAFGFVSHAEVHKTMSSPPTSPIAAEPIRELLLSPSAPRRVLGPVEPRKAAPMPAAGLDFKKFDVSETDVIGRPARSRTSSSESDTENKVKSGRGKTAGLLPTDEEDKRSQVEEKPTKEQLDEIRVLLRNDYTNYSLFCVNLKRDAGVEDGSVGLILTSTMSAFDSFITVQRVITGSIADRDGRLCKGDRIFFIQGKPTEKMTASEARSLMKSPAPAVKLIVGRPLLQGYSSMTLSSTASDATAMFTEDPATHRYEQKPIVVTLVKSDLGVGFSMDGGRGSKYGDRPIVVKKVFAAGEAARNGQVSIGDEIRSIDGIQLSGMTHLEAWKTLKSMREGPLEFVVYKRIVE